MTSGGQRFLCYCGSRDNKAGQIDLSQRSLAKQVLHVVIEPADADHRHFGGHEAAA
jgi:hypothetical protein